MGACLGACVQCATEFHDRYTAWKWRNDSFSEIPTNHTDVPRKNTTLHGAVIDKNITEIRRLCFENPVQCNAINHCGETILHQACQLGYTQVVEELLCCGCKANICTNSGSALHSVVKAVKGKYISSQDGCQLMNLLASHGCFVDHKTGNGATALYRAAELGEALLVETLLSLGANVNINESNGFTPLYISVFQRELECVFLFLKDDIGLQIDKKDSEGRTALMSALINLRILYRSERYMHSKQGIQNQRSVQMSIIELLLYAGASPNECDNQGRRPLHVAFDIVKEIGTTGVVSEESGDEIVEVSMFEPIIRIMLFYGGYAGGEWAEKYLDLLQREDTPAWLRKLYQEVIEFMDKSPLPRPFCLMHISRIAVRKQLARTTNTHLLHTLSLPTKLQKYLLYQIYY